MTPSYRNHRQRRYDKYLMSPHWQQLRVVVLKRANGACEWCKRPCPQPPHHAAPWCGLEACVWCTTYFDDCGDSLDIEPQFLEVHHRTYERVGCELLTDLLALCWDCHDIITARASVITRVGIAKSKFAPRLAETFFGDVPTSRRGLWRASRSHAVAGEG